MAKSVRVFISDTQDPWFNLATEDWIFREMEANAQTLFLWRNAETVVIGRNQNPWSECNLALMESDGVRLARRTTGGGAVFQDLGNTCFTFLSPKDGYDRGANLSIVIAALRRFGIEAAASGRNDLVIESEDGPKKVSGSAFRETKDRSFHHGTLLIDTDLTRLAKYLTPHPKKMASKGRASVRSRVMNLGELAPALTHANLSEALIEEFFRHHGARAEIENLDPAHLESRPALREMHEKLASWDWRFGHAPKFAVQFAEYLTWGFVEVHLDTEDGKIIHARVFSDGLIPELVEDLERALVGQAFNGAGIANAVGVVLAEQPSRATELAEVERWLRREIEI